MKRFSEITYIALTAVILVITACGSKSSNEDPMAQLTSLKEHKSTIDAQIASLEKELEAKGLIAQKLRTVGLTEIKIKSFSHFIDLQGRVDASESVAATSRIPGTLKRVHVDNGDFVKSGQLLAEIDDAILQKNIAELEGQLVVATDLYVRQKTLWDQNIGSEVQ
ncbi:biotin/lipoyl-binding protein, partial [Dolichospermum sp. ST_sed3]|nr:biotin/lipoyl-binding protein [Dolichospermum sp. ST_sed3]